MPGMVSGKGRVVHCSAEQKCTEQNARGPNAQQARAQAFCPKPEGDKGEALPHLHFHGATCHNAASRGKGGFRQVCRERAHDHATGDDQRAACAVQAGRKGGVYHAAIL